MKTTNTLSFLKPVQQTPAYNEWIIKINDLELMCSIGVFERERNFKQPVRISLKCYTRHSSPSNKNSYYVCYNNLIEKIINYINDRHIDLVEMFAEDICAICFEELTVHRVWVSVEKTKVYENVASVGVEIERERQ